MIFLGLGKPKSGHWTQLCSLRSTTFGDFPKGDPNQQTEKVHGKRPMFFSKFYPVNIQKTMENHHVWWGKSPIKSINEPWLPVRSHRPPHLTKAFEVPARCATPVQSPSHQVISILTAIPTILGNGRFMTLIQGGTPQLCLHQLS